MGREYIDQLESEVVGFTKLMENLWQWWWEVKINVHLLTADNVQLLHRIMSPISPSVNTDDIVEMKKILGECIEQ